MDSYGILSALAERTITAEEAKTMTLLQPEVLRLQVNEASLALLLIDNTLDAIKAAASEGRIHFTSFL
ncbi:hypothetical protein [Escherichia coli]|uniref:hypothetical protein n=1 Tax=Escherichia coli TaxID=562 RepID=UPI001F065F11|nr:hypothetical protein [Escherichia coli]